jgi:hypothetical protein
MKLRAHISAPTAGRWAVVFEHTTPDGRKDWGQPSIEIPCTSYEHAQAVTHAFNEEPRK